MVLVGLFWRAQRGMVTRLLRGSRPQHQMLGFFSRYFFFVRGSARNWQFSGSRSRSRRTGRRAPCATRDRMESRGQRRSGKSRKSRESRKWVPATPANAGAQRNPSDPYSVRETGKSKYHKGVVKKCRKSRPHGDAFILSARTAGRSRIGSQSQQEEVGVTRVVRQFDVD